MPVQQAQDRVDALASSLPAATESLPDRTMDPAAGGESSPAGEISKNAAKKAAKKEKQAAEKAGKLANKGIGMESKNKLSQKAPKKKTDGPALIGIDVSKEGDFAGWYQQVLLKGQMLDYYDVSGCFILKPHSYFIWETIQNWFDDRIKKMGVKNCSFPLFVSEDVLKKEKDHIEGFAAEVAWVTHAGNSKLERKIAIRPTSETVMYPYYAKWIRSHRDLPLRLNQWNSVVRWEFKNPQPFLRTREFLWQEGHTAHLTEGGAREEVLQILEHYAHVYEELLAIPVIRGQKTEKEKFAGGLYTTTVEGYIPATGRGIQGGTSHGLGQNFSKMFGITVEDPSAKPDEKKPALHVWQNSWGLSTRTIGIMVMVHGDDHGKSTIPITELAIQVPALLETIQADLYSRANATYKSHVKRITNWDDFTPALNDKNLCMIPHCLTEQCEDEIKDMSARKAEEETGEAQDARAPSMGAKSLCIPFEQPEGIEKGVTKCTNPNCKRVAEKWCLFGRSY
ncbi:prolyl-tRNA synthetase, partial [Histoplasma capsulatum]